MVTAATLMYIGDTTATVASRAVPHVHTYTRTYHDTGGGGVVDRLEEVVLCWSGVVRQHVTQRLLVFELWSQTSSDHIVTAGHALHTVYTMIHNKYSMDNMQQTLMLRTVMNYNSY